MKTSLMLLILIASLSLLSGCQTMDGRGQYIDDGLVERLQNKNLTRVEVEDLIGTPNIVPDYEPNKWYYVHRFMVKRAWFKPKVVTQRIVMILFNQNGTVEEVEVINQSHHDDIEVISEYTKSYGTEQNGLQTFVKNIGRFNKTTDGKKKKKQ